MVERAFYVREGQTLVRWCHFFCSFDFLFDRLFVRSFIRLLIRSLIHKELEAEKWRAINAINTKKQVQEGCAGSCLVAIVERKNIVNSTNKTEDYLMTERIDEHLLCIDSSLSEVLCYFFSPIAAFPM